ncbi:acyltransferase family protein [Mucilaginibacter sp.]|uniref:acyltransferase family protein n=1 Tax=Mucilaginibacter sp. TaxID=1882438 RepID=UPI003D0F46D5
MKKIYLEFFRGGSSIFILGWHLVFLAPTGHATKFTGYWGTDALMMFFMLSGLVINLTETNKPKSTKAFLINRFIRIYPLFVIGMLLAFLALYITNTAFPSLTVIIGNFLLVSTMKDYMGYIVPSIESNLAVWSLSFEVAFYVLFAFTIGRNQKKAVLYWFIIALLAIPCYFLKVQHDVFYHLIAVFAFSSIWLVGYYIYEYRNLFYADKYVALFGLGVLPLISRMHFTWNFYDPFKYFILSLFAVPFFRYCLQLPPAGKKIKLIYLIVPHIIIVYAALTIRYLPLANALAYSTLPYVYMGIGYLVNVLNIKTAVLNMVNKVGTVTGKYSYALYITHFPLVFLFSKLFHNLWAYVFLSLPVIAFTAYSLETWLQPAIVNYFKKKRKQNLPQEPPLNIPNATTAETYKTGEVDIHTAL